MSPEELRAVVERCLRTVAPEADPGALAPEADLRDELDIDSMDFLRYVTALHKELGVDIAEADYPKLRTIGGTLGFLGPAVATR